MAGRQMLTVKELMNNTPRDVRTRARDVMFSVTRVWKKSLKTDKTAIIFESKSIAATETVYYDQTVVLYPDFYEVKNEDGTEEKQFEIPNMDHLCWVHCTCFTGDTLVMMADGTSVPISSLVGKDEFFVYSFDTKSQKYVIGRGERCEVKAKDAEIYEVELDNGHKIKCTGDHKFLLRDGKTYVEAKDLRSGESLMAMYRQIGIQEATNHKVVSVKRLDERQDVYCFTVPEYGNFVIDVDGGKSMSSGVTVSNCPFFLYTVQYVLAQHGNTSLGQCLNRRPTVTNFREIPYVCKHLYRGLPDIIEMMRQISSSKRKTWGGGRT